MRKTILAALTVLLVVLSLKVGSICKQVVIERQVTRWASCARLFGDIPQCRLVAQPADLFEKFFE